MSQFQSSRALLSGIWGAILLLSLLGPFSSPTQSNVDAKRGYFVLDSCTIFTAAIGETVFFGNNEDYRLEGTYLWIMPPYGAVGFGFKYNDDPADGWVQGGMNDQGLCLDANGLPTVSLNPHAEREPLYKDALLEVLFECATVDEVIEWFQTHYFGTVWSCQIHFADASGDAVVVSAGPDGEFAFTRKNSSHYLVSTNFNLANYENGYYPCNRYDTATAMLAAITSEEGLTVEACRDILDAVHIEGEYATKYSNIFDPVNQQLYLFQNHEFDTIVTLDVENEIAQVDRGDAGVIEEIGFFYKEIKIGNLFEAPVTSDGTSSSQSTNEEYSSSLTTDETHFISAFELLIGLVAVLILRKGYRGHREET
ncbi:MAG: hypothetical protein ACE5OZ_24090 [Candidatus Heimdallarchaeota archaeon]